MAETEKSQPSNGAGLANPSQKDLESQSIPKAIPHWRMIVDQGALNSDIENWKYEGSGTEEDPYVVVWIDQDPRNPFNFSASYRWSLVLVSAFSVLTVALCSSAFSGGLPQLLQDFKANEEIGILGLSLFVLGFALGPLFWAPLSEMYGRQVLFALTFMGYTVFDAGAVGSKNIQTVIILRFFAGAFGSSPLTNSGGVIADCFAARDRGLAMSVFAAAPFLGPSLGPVIGGFLGEAAGWKWVLGFLAAISGLGWFLGMAFVPETYAPVLLRRRAQALSKKTGKVYRSKVDIDRGTVSLGSALQTALTRPWILLFREPIVLFLSIYMAIVYGILYLLFAAFPIVYTQGRGWSQGIGGLAFIGVAIGMISAVIYTIFIVNPAYLKTSDKHGGYAPPEARLVPCMLGGVLLPIGLFWFSWTNSPSLPWAASMAAGIPFGFASVLAANAVMRSLFGAAFPLFTNQMYAKLGIHWASSIPAFLALMCVPFPFLFYKYGASIRAKCKFASEAEEFLKRIRGETAEQQEQDDLEREELEEEAFEDVEKKTSSPKEEVEEPQARTGSDATDELDEHMPRFERVRTGRSQRSQRSNAGSMHEWDDNPYVIDRVNTRESFKARRSRSASRASKASRK